MGSGRWAVGSGRWAVGGGRWAVGGGRWAVGGGHWAVGRWRGGSRRCQAKGAIVRTDAVLIAGWQVRGIGRTAKRPEVRSRQSRDRDPDSPFKVQARTPGKGCDRRRRPHVPTCSAGLRRHAPPDPDVGSGARLDCPRSAGPHHRGDRLCGHLCGGGTCAFVGRLRRPPVHRPPSHLRRAILGPRRSVAAIA